MVDVRITLSGLWIATMLRCGDEPELEGPMPPIRPSADVLSMTKFRANTSSMIEQMHSTGRGAAVLLDPSVCESFTDEIELLRHLSVAEAQIAAGQVVSHGEVARARARSTHCDSRLD